MQHDRREKIFWEVLPFRKLPPGMLYDILHLRSAVFIIEQDCIYQDMDYLDQEARHLTAYREKELVAYARLLPANTRFEEASIGRIVTASSVRGTGIGKALVQRSIDYCRNEFKAGRIRISAQCYLERFYSEFGFRNDSAVYQEDGIDHREMVLDL